MFWTPNPKKIGRCAAESYFFVPIREPPPIFFCTQTPPPPTPRVQLQCAQPRKSLKRVGDSGRHNESQEVYQSGGDFPGHELCLLRVYTLQNTLVWKIFQLIGKKLENWKNGIGKLEKIGQNWKIGKMRIGKLENWKKFENLNFFPIFHFFQFSNFFPILKIEKKMENWKKWKIGKIIGKKWKIWKIFQFSNFPILIFPIFQFFPIFSNFPIPFFPIFHFFPINRNIFQTNVFWRV